MNLIRIFISSIQKKLSEERMVLRNYLQNVPRLRRFFEGFLFEDMPTDQRADQSYLSEVKKSDILRDVINSAFSGNANVSSAYSKQVSRLFWKTELYYGPVYFYLVIFGNKYDGKDKYDGEDKKNGFSLIHEEYNPVTKLKRERLIYSKGANDKVRHIKMKVPVRKTGDDRIRRRFNSDGELRTAVYASLVHVLEEREHIRFSPLVASYCRSASMNDLDNERITEFPGLARRGRCFPLPESSSPKRVLSKINLWVGMRKECVQIPVRYEFPQEVVIDTGHEKIAAKFPYSEIVKPVAPGSEICIRKDRNKTERTGTSAEERWRPPLILKFSQTPNRNIADVLEKKQMNELPDFSREMGNLYVR